MGWQTLTVTASSGSKTVSVVSGSTANIKVGDALQVGAFSLCEITGVYAGQLTIKDNWGNATQTGASASVIPTFGDFNTAVSAINKLKLIINDNYQALNDWTTGNGEVTFTGLDGMTYTVKSASAMEAFVNGLETGLDNRIVEAIAEVALPEPDVYIPFNDSLQIVRGFGKHDQIDVSAAQDGSVMVELPTKSVEFSRASGSSRITRSGQIEALDVNSPSISKNGINVTASYTNEHRNSEDFTQPYWSKEGSIIVEDGVLAPDGVSTAQSLTITTTNAFQSLRLISAPSLVGETWCSSVFCKAGTISKFRIIANAAGSVAGVSNASAEFNLTEGTAVNISGCKDVGIVECADGWFLCYSVYTKDSDGNQLKLVDVSSTGAVIGDYLYAWGAQLTKTTMVMPYIKTENVAAAASGVTARIPIKDNLPSPGQPFTIVVDTEIPLYGGGGTSGLRYVFTTNRNSVSTPLGLLRQSNNNIVARINFESANYDCLIPSEVTTTEKTRYTVRYDGSKLELFANGISYGSIGIPGIEYDLNEYIYFGSFGISGWLTKPLSEFIIFFRACSDAEILAMGAAK